MAESSINDNAKKIKKSKRSATIDIDNRLQWTLEMVKDLLEGLLEYKFQVEYRNSDFNPDKVKQYEVVRIILANKYRDGSLFGPTEIPAYTEEDNKEDYTRSCEKFKAQIRRG